MSDFNVIDIKSRRRRGKTYVEQCYTCGCGGQLFLLCPNGSCVCMACDMINTPLKVMRVEPLMSGEEIESAFDIPHHSL